MERPHRRWKEHRGFKMKPKWKVDGELKGNCLEIRKKSSRELNLNRKE